MLASLLLFPVVLNYLSPYVIIDAPSQGVINGSFIMFGLFFVSSLFVGWLWCGWACPGVGLQEACFSVNDKPARGGRSNWTKWGIWIPRIGIIGFVAASAGGYRTVNFLHLTDTGVSVTSPYSSITYYLVIGTFVALSLAAGRRAGLPLHLLDGALYDDRALGPESHRVAVLATQS